MSIAGIGCRRGVSAAEVLAAIEAAGGPARLRGLAALPRKAGEAGLRAAAEALGLPLILPEEAALAAAAPRALTRSAACLSATGLPSAAEVAALAVAGPGARLRGPRLVHGRVTIAVSEPCA